MAEFSQAADPLAKLPRQHMAIWNGLLLGIQGKPLPAGPEIANDPIRSAGRRFPDLWTVRLMERSRAGIATGLTITLLLALGAAWCLVHIVKNSSTAAPTCPDRMMPLGRVP